MHFGYNTGFDGRGRFSLSDGSGFGKNITEFGAEMILLCMLRIEKKHKF